MSQSVRPTVGPTVGQRRGDRWLWPLAALCGLLFFLSLGRLWPLADADLTAPPRALHDRAVATLRDLGLVRADSVGAYAWASRLTTEEGALDHVERTFGRDAAQTLIRAGAALTSYEVQLKRRGDPDGLYVELDARGAVRGWARGVQDDAPGARLAADSARTLARAAFDRVLGGEPVLDSAGGVGALPGVARPGTVHTLRSAYRHAPWRETGVATRERPARVDHTVTFERLLVGQDDGTFAVALPGADATADSATGGAGVTAIARGDARTATPARELRERAVLVVSGDRVTNARRWLVVPASAERAARVRAAPVRALQTVGFGLLAAGAIGALAVLLAALRDGRVRLARAAVMSGIVFVCALGTQALASYDLLAGWDPLWPRAVAALSDLGWRTQGTAWTFVVLFALVAAGDALDRQMHGGAEGRGATLWRLVRGGPAGLADPAVGLASARGFAVGLVCGGVMAATVWLLERTAGALVGVQPTGFFFFALNSAAPSIATLLFFTNIALLEELGYRFFAGAWLLRWSGRRWLAIVAPAVVYGLTHTGLSFLPPVEPFWGRALVMTLVGCVWGWAFLRWDALTVVTSHLTADLFIFNWPRIASAHADVRLAALATVAAPLLPAVVAGAATLAATLARRTGRAQDAEGAIPRDDQVAAVPRGAHDPTVAPAASSPPPPA